MAKTEKSKSKNKNSTNKVPVTAFSTLKNGTLKQVKAFASIGDAAKWIYSKGVTASTLAARTNISNAKNGRESRENPITRFSAYGYTWK